jgi:rhodanese-related sulfurtransferase
MKIFKQILYILLAAVIIGLIANAVNPKGVPLVMDKNIYALDTAKKKEEKKLPDFRNDPYDTTANKQFNNVFNGTPNKEGFIEPENISGSLAKQLYDRNALFIDARTKPEFDSLHIKGAINIPYEDFHNLPVEQRKEMMRKYNKDGIIIVYCKGGKCEVSIDLAYDIARLGFRSVSIYRGGIHEWKDSGYPVEP